MAVGLVFLCQLSSAYAASRCVDLIGVWDGDWQAGDQSKRATRAFFTHMTSDGYFKGYYVFMDKPDVAIQFTGQCKVTDFGYDQLAFAPTSGRANICAGLYNFDKGLWMGCPFIQEGGLYRKNVI